MRYSNDIRNKALELLATGLKATDVARSMQSDSNSEKTPSAATIRKWKHESEAVSPSPVESHERKAQIMKDHDVEVKVKANAEIINAQKIWQINSEKYVYKPKTLEVADSIAREQYHGKTLENKLHMGIYQIKPRGTEQVRTKKIGDKELKLTSQDHIFPHSNIKNSKDSYNPENIREGNAVYNNFLSNHLDPMFCDNGRSISKSTADMLIKYSLTPLKTSKDFENEKAQKKYIKNQSTFKYTDNGNIVSSNMVTDLDKSMNSSFEAPELGLLDGPNNIISARAYSVPLYKLDSNAGILDVTYQNYHNPALDSQPAGHDAVMGADASA